MHNSPDVGRSELKALSKARLIRSVLELQSVVCLQKHELNDQANKIDALTTQLTALKEAQEIQKTQAINKEVNKPSSKKPEWDKDGNPKSSKQDDKKVKRTKRAGCGNSSKSDLTLDGTYRTTQLSCPDCETGLIDRKGSAKPARIVEDTAPPEKKTRVSAEIEETKWCPRCRKMVSSKTEAALPGSDIGLNATIEMAYLWVMCALSFPNIQGFFKQFKTLKVSTAGISKMMIRLSNILNPVYEEILDDVKQGAAIWADETGWRVNGKLWWLWIFANKRSAYYWMDPTRAGDVVE